MNKQSLPLPALLIVICLFYLSPLLKSGFYISHDGEAHVARFAAYFKAYKDGQIPPRWAGDINFRYGSPLFIFYYPLPGTVASFIHTLGISLEDSFKLIMVFAFVLAPLAFYAWSSQFVKQEVAFVGSFLYGFAPYHFLDLYVRGDVAEILSFVFVPLVFLYMEKLKARISLKYIFIGGICYALLILSHNVISLMLSPVFLTYSFIHVNRRGVVSCIALLLVGLFLSLFFWLPALVEGQFTQAKLFIGDMYKLHFPTLQQLVSSNWGFDADVYKSGGLSPQIGIAHIFLAFASGLLIIKKTREYKTILYWLILFIFVVFLSLRQSGIIWQNVPLLKLFQFPWRFTALSSFVASVLGLYVLNKILSKKILIAVLVILITPSFSFIKTKEVPAKSDRFYYEYKGSTDYHGAATTIWSAGNPGEVAKNPIEVISGNARIERLIRKSNRHEFVVDADSHTRILDNTIYFPGWQAQVDSKKVPIEFQDINHRGLITFKVPEGNHRIDVKFKESPIRFFSDIISLFSIASITLIFLTKAYFSFSKKNE